MDENQLIMFDAQTQALSARCLAQSNRVSSQFGLVLSERQIQTLVSRRREALAAVGRLEFGTGVLHLLAETFCDSPYLCQANYEETLGMLQALFYYYKNESRDRLSDWEVIDGMKRIFDGPAQGAIQYLADAPVEALIDPDWRERE